MEVGGQESVAPGLGVGRIEEVGDAEEDPEAEAVSAWEERTSFLRLIAAESPTPG